MDWASSVKLRELADRAGSCLSVCDDRALLHREGVEGVDIEAEGVGTGLRV